ncbi:MAG: FHA domain-containing protein [Anaerolineae bacterium]|nr:FHA domain-containing protein [Anaerolineae bacterium]
MVINQSTSLGPRCQLCTSAQLEACLAQLSFSERAKDSIRQLYASGEVNPIIESYLQHNCALIDSPGRKNNLGLQSRLAQKADPSPTEQSQPGNLPRAQSDTTPNRPTPEHMADVRINPAPPEVKPPSASKRGTDELAALNANPARYDNYMLTVLDTQHRIRLPEYGEFVLGSWETLGSPHPDINLLYDDRGQHSVSPRHARVFIKNNVHYIEDLDSEHGTWLNDQQLEVLQPVAFNPGDTLCMGRCILEVAEVPAYWLDPASVYTLYTTTSGKEIALPQHGELIVGRSDPSSGYKPDIDLADEVNLALGVSRRHIALRCWMHNIEFSDLGSTNGTELEGIRIPPGIWVTLRPGQHIVLGGFGLALQVKKSKTTSI